MNCGDCGRELPVGRMICDCTPSNAKPMVCPKCHAEVPEGKIACTCFLVAFDNEIESLALKNFAGGDRLYLTTAPTSGHHLMPNASCCLTLCRKRRLRSPGSRRFSQEIEKKALAITNGEHVDWCLPCLIKALNSLPSVSEATLKHLGDYKKPRRAAIPMRRKTKKVAR